MLVFAPPTGNLRQFQQRLCAIIFIVHRYVAGSSMWKEVFGMLLWEVIVLGLVQGLTEFLPVSSSGHLVLTQSLLGVNSPGLLLEIVLHLGTLISVIIVYWQDVLGLFRGLFSLIRNPRGKRVDRETNTYRRMIGLLLVGMIPAAVLGLTLEPVFSRLFDSPFAVGLAMLLTGVVLFLISRQRPGRRDFRKMNWLDALFVGLAQGIAITPGLSRSGMTISGALSRKLDRETATRYSFLLSLPTIAGAAVLQLADVLGDVSQVGDIKLLVAGFLAATLAGIFAIKLLVNVLKKGRLQYFAYYVWIIGLIAIWRAA